MELTGKVKLIMDMQTFDSGFTKREFVVTTAEQYPQDIKLECIKDKCSLLDTLNVGDEVKVQFNLRGNEYQGRYFVNLQAWKIDKSTVEEQPAIPEYSEADVPAASDDEQDDLPF